VGVLAGAAVLLMSGPFTKAVTEPGSVLRRG